MFGDTNCRICKVSGLLLIEYWLSGQIGDGSFKLLTMEY